MMDRIADGRTDLVFDFVEGGNPATFKDPHGVSLIQWCAYYGDVSGIKFLLSKGESLSTLGDNLDLNGAAFHGHWRLCQFLIESGADVNHPLPDTGETLLHSATSKTNRPTYTHVLRILLGSGANPNCATKPGVETGSFMRDCKNKGETPLHRAAAFCSEEAIQLLVDAGARIDATDANGETPLSWASWHLRPANVQQKLCYGPHRIHPDAVTRAYGEFGLAGGGMEASLLGTPHV